MVILGLTQSVARAQSLEFQLDDQQGWTQTEAPIAGTDEAVLAQTRRLIAQNKPRQAKGVIDAWITQNERSGNSWLAEALVLRANATTAMGSEFRALFDYERVIREFPSSPAFVQAVQQELEIGKKYLNGMKRKFLKLRINSAYGYGEELLIRVQERMPASRLAEEAGIELADYYYRIRDMKQAAVAYEMFILNHPTSQYRVHAEQQRIYANIARFRGPRYDGGGLEEANALIKQFVQRYPLQAQRSGIGDALSARIDESAGAQMLDTAMWYLNRKDMASTRFMLKRLIRKHPRSLAASNAISIMQDYGWLEQSAQETTDDLIESQDQLEDQDSTPVSGGDAP